MAKTELGTKRVCPNCGAKYYDLNKSPAVCPKCGTEFVVATAKARPQEVPEKVKEDVTEKVDDAVPAVETISLEEADEELAGSKKNAEGDGEDEEDDDIEVADDDDDDTFLEDDEDEDDDVADIIGDVDGEDD